MKMKKALAMLLAVIMIIAVSVAGTLAWLTATSETVTNTFSVGDINITLQEYPFKEDSATELDKTATPVQNIDTYKVVPGGNQPKEPFVTVKAESENCYVYVCVQNNLTIDKAIVVAYDINNTEWEQVATKTDNSTGAVTTLYRYKEIITTSNDDQSKTVFTKVSYSDDILKDTISQLKDKTIVLNALAHQSDNITDVTVADTAAKTHFGLS